jgi:hypothetical protein
MNKFVDPTPALDAEYDRLLYDLRQETGPTSSRRQRRKFRSKQRRIERQVYGQAHTRVW